MKYILAVFLIAAFFMTGCSSSAGRYYDDTGRRMETNDGMNGTGTANGTHNGTNGTTVNGTNGTNGTMRDTAADGLAGANGGGAMYGTDGGVTGANGSLAGTTNTGRNY